MANRLGEWAHVESGGEWSQVPALHLPPAHALVGGCKMWSRETETVEWSGAVIISIIHDQLSKIETN